MKLRLLLLLICTTTSLLSQSNFSIGLNAGGAFAKMGEQKDESYARSNLLPVYSIDINYSGIFEKHFNIGLRYSMGGHRYKIQNYFNNKKVSAQLVQHAIGLNLFNNLPIEIKKKGKSNNIKSSCVSGIYSNYIITSAFSFADEPKLNVYDQVKPFDFGLVGGLDLHLRDNRSHLCIKLRYFHGLKNLAKDDFIWKARRLELGLQIGMTRNKND
ncbi:MAG: outer membrane beta-barrel protein [Saprospiraceae bacterium]